MKKLRLERTAEGERLITDATGLGLLRYPLLNKGTGFTIEERRVHGIEALLPSRHNDIERQADRIYKSILHNPDMVGRNIGLAALQDRNEHLYYKVLSKNLEELMPIVYTPTVGRAAQHFSRVFRRSRGLFITPDHRGRIAEVMRTALPIEDIRLMVVTDNESILGIGDQGAGGMAISIGKLALYIAGGGIHPLHTLPVSLDVGTNNEELLDDPFYLGYPERRLRGDDYLSLVDEFVEACKEVFPKALIQWEDFRKDNALTILDRYRDGLLSFNDDIQGTGAVATACVSAASTIADIPPSDLRILVYGAGAAGLGISRQLKNLLSNAGLRGEALARAVLVMDSRGVLSDARSNLDVYKEEMAWPDSMVRELGLGEQGLNDLAEVTRAYKANVLIGTSGQGGAFDKDVVDAISANCERPVILPMSNPTSISEAVPSQLLDWTNGRALIATGSPFDPVKTADGEVRIGQANNVFVFPGIGIGAIVSGATSISSTMIAASATAVADSLTDQERSEGSLVPRVSRLWEVCGNVGLAVAKQAVSEGLAPPVEDDVLEAALDAFRWKPRYPEIVFEP